MHSGSLVASWYRTSSLFECSRCLTRQERASFVRTSLRVVAGLLSWCFLLVCGALVVIIVLSLSV